MKNCKEGHRKPKHLPYGAERGVHWCDGCDAELVPKWMNEESRATKRRERMRAKREIRRREWDGDKDE